LPGSAGAAAETERGDSGGRGQQHGGGMTRWQHGGNSERALLKESPNLRMKPNIVKRDNWAAIAQRINTGLCCTNTLEALRNKTFAIGRLIENVLRGKDFSRFMQQSLNTVSMA